MHHPLGVNVWQYTWSVANLAAHLSLWYAHLLSGLCAIAHVADLYFPITIQV